MSSVAQVLRSPAALSAGRWQLVTGAAWWVVAVGVATFIGGGWQLLVPMLLAGSIFLVVGFVQRRTRVELVAGGLRVFDARRSLRVTHVRWAKVRRLRVDPHAEPRRVRLTLTDRREVALPALTDADTAVVVDAHRAVTRKP